VALFFQKETCIFTQKMKFPLFKSLIFILLASSSQAQVRGKGIGLGIKAGVNIAKVAGGADSVTYNYSNGLMVGGYFSPGGGLGPIGFRTELIFSRQGFRYRTASNRTGQVTNDYVLLPQLMLINLSKFFQLQVGGQMGILLRSEDSNPPAATGGGGTGTPVDDVLKYFNRIDWGLAGGAEIYPSKRLMLGGRYNLGLSKLNRSDPGTTPGLPTNYNPYNVDTRNSVIQVYAGFRF
jgi:hypothetical protein